MGQIIISPEDDPEYIREQVRKTNIVGLKCYQLFSSDKPTMFSSIEGFLTEGHMKVAD